MPCPSLLDEERAGAVGRKHKFLNFHPLEKFRPTKCHPGGLQLPGISVSPFSESKITPLSRSSGKALPWSLPLPESVLHTYTSFSKADNSGKPVKVFQTRLRPTLCDPVDCSPPGPSIHGVPQARTTLSGCRPLLQGMVLTPGSTRVCCTV